MQRAREFLLNCLIVSLMVCYTTGVVLGLLDISGVTKNFPPLVTLVVNCVLLIAAIGLFISVLGISFIDAAESSGGPLWRRLAECTMSWLKLFIAAAFVALTLLQLGPIGFFGLLILLVIGAAIFVKVSQWFESRRCNIDNANSSTAG